MSKGIILYQSKYGTTKKYAQWLSEATGFDCAETKKATVAMLSGYDTVVLGGGVYASGILGLNFFKKNISALEGKKLAVFAVGASPYDEKALDQIRELHFSHELCEVPLFCCRGAFDEKSMKPLDRALCRMLRKAVEKQDPSTYEPWQAALMESAGQSCDWSDKSWLEPLIEYLNQD